MVLLRDLESKSSLKQALEGVGIGLIFGLTSFEWNFLFTSTSGWLDDNRRSGDFRFMPWGARCILEDFLKIHVDGLL